MSQISMESAELMNDWNFQIRNIAINKEFTKIGRDQFGQLAFCQDKYYKLQTVNNIPVDFFATNFDHLFFRHLHKNLQITQSSRLI